MARSYKFAVIRVTPDFRRGETVNVGLAVFAHGPVDVRILPNLSKLQSIDGTVDLSSIFELDSKIPKFVSDVETVDQKIDMLSEIGFIKADDVGEFLAHDSETYERRVADLMDRLVRPKRKIVHHASDSRISSDFRKKLKSRGILGGSLADIDRHLVVPRFPISAQLDLYADFALKNGAMNLVKTIDFRSKNAPSAEKFREACAVSFSFVKSLEEFKTPRRFVLYAADKDVISTVDRHLNVLSEDADYVLNYESTVDRRFLLDSLEEAATGQAALH